MSKTTHWRSKYDAPTTTLNGRTTARFAATLSHVCQLKRPPSRSCANMADDSSVYGLRGNDEPVVQIQYEHEAYPGLFFKYKESLTELCKAMKEANKNFPDDSERFGVCVQHEVCDVARTASTGACSLHACVLREVFLRSRLH